MSALLSQIAGIAALVPALQFGQVPNFLDVKDATKDAFQATSKAFDSVNAKTNAAAKKAAASRKNSKATKAPTAPSDAPNTMFSKLGQQADGGNGANGKNQRIADAEEKERKVLGFLGSSTDMIYRVILSVAGVAVAGCIGLRIREKVRDYSTGRPSLAKSRIVRR